MQITAETQPELFAFVNRIADEAGAPRPHKVFVTARVNAAVFYDLSFRNLLFPTRKNLEIGLGLVEGLTLDELKAVIAHEFGHFAQRTMAVGRWVYVSHQIAGHVIVHRGWIDNLLRGLSYTDIRIAWIGWILRLLVWSIRAVFDTAFRLIVLAHRALSREMELQADLVAVSVSGSDSLIHALHRLGPVDDAWDAAVRFSNTEIDKKRPPEDLFSIQARVLEHLRRVFDDETFGEGTQNLETAEVRAEHHAASTTFEHREEFRLAVNLDLEMVEPARQQVDAIQDGGGECVVVAEVVAKARGVGQHTRQEGGRCPPRLAGEQHEIEGDRVQQHAACGATEAAGDGGDQPDQEGAAAF